MTDSNIFTNIFWDTGGGSAEKVTYDNTTSGLTAETVQDAIDEVQSNIVAKDEADEISYDNASSGLTATDVQAAIDEVQGNIEAVDTESLSIGDVEGLVATTVQGAIEELANANFGTAVRASRSADQTLPGTTNTLVQLNVVDYDERDWFENTTYKFSPQQEGYYQVNAGVLVAAGVSDKAIRVRLYRNGTDKLAEGQQVESATGYNIRAHISDIVYLNGSTDYLQLYAYNADGTSRTLVGSSASTFMSMAYVAGIIPDA